MTGDLFDAIEQYDLQGLEKLLAADENPNQVQDEWVRLRPLHAAIVALSEGGSVDAITVLLRRGADINLTYPDIGGGTPLL